MGGHLYIFLDEGGNLDFSARGTKYFVMTAIVKTRPFDAYKELAEIKYDLIESGLDLEYFHASEDRQIVRDVVFRVIKKHLDVILDSLVVEKRKVDPVLRAEERFFPEMLGYLLKYVLGCCELSGYDEILIFTDAIPLKRKREAIEKAIKKVLKRVVPPFTKYRIFHHASKSSYDLQIADYCNWSIFRKWESGDARSYDIISSAVRSEYDIFRAGGRYYY
ncbi:MAG: hypothetical protein CVU77_02260 [Elusimicrobia bacterium HGW-Elusimicrobia-1]|jgi:hypothetical protein|nr:MAG: hypothetical protein CVU77_02260 [Elusimicrobia bacterium HGW-Elusimicrobia-1]